ncbi:hypothetical protein DSO57_1025727 [Entomophthora muscae]|uniref:Uncharacterized protein n=1 Tax=Entomophthora muscae TaxID=34485 RepID=A0ACC2UMS5_9FUNG|nr:hypothetical protein DSO57_1025727 [Entomophthora muscae]
MAMSNFLAAPEETLFKILWGGGGGGGGAERGAGGKRGPGRGPGRSTPPPRGAPERERRNEEGEGKTEEETGKAPPKATKAEKFQPTPKGQVVEFIRVWKSLVASEVVGMSLARFIWRTSISLFEALDFSSSGGP